MKNKKLYLHQIKSNAKKLIGCKTLADLALVLKIDAKKLQLQAFNPLYYHFSVRKKNGGLRYIEAPELALKDTQRRLNVLFQSYYYLKQTRSSYGYIISPKNKAATKNILTNAQQHLGNDYLLNADFKDFFHQITQSQVNKLLQEKPFCFTKNLVNTLSKLVSYKERLPMGAPTSPVLSNIYCIRLDNQLQTYCSQNNIKYTRFVDDLSFSANHKLKFKYFTEITTICHTHNLKFNPLKVTYYNKEESKKVTGLLLNNTVDIDAAFYSELTKDIQRLKYTIEVIAITNNHNTVFLRSFKQEIMGKINFIAQIEGYESKEYNTYLKLFNAALNPPEDLQLRWTKFNTYN